MFSAFVFVPFVIGDYKRALKDIHSLFQISLRVLNNFVPYIRKVIAHRCWVVLSICHSNVRLWYFLYVLVVVFVPSVENTYVSFPFLFCTCRSLLHLAQFSHFAIICQNFDTDTFVLKVKINYNFNKISNTRTKHNHILFLLA